MAVTIDGTKGVATPSGSAGSPSHADGSFVNGLYFPTSTSAALATNGAVAVTIDSSQNVGIGTGSPAYKLDVRATGDNAVYFATTGTNNSISAFLASGNGTTSGKYAYFRFLNNDTNAQEYRLGTYGDNNFTIYDAKAAATRLMINTSGEVGIGTTATGGWKLAVIATYGIRTGDGTSEMSMWNNGGVGYLTTNSNSPLALGINGVEKARLDTSGNLGLGGTPSAWGSGLKAIQIGTGLQPSVSYVTGFDAALNAYYDTSWKYNYTGYAATRYSQASGQHAWFTAGTGTAGTAIAFTTAMTLDASGNLGVGTTTINNRLEVGGAVAIQRSTNTARVSKLTNENGNFEIIADSSYNMIFNTGGSERARIDSSGNLLVGTTTANGLLTVAGIARGGLAHRSGTYTAGSTTPSVTGVSYMTITNSSATTIVNFTGAVDGQMLYLVFTDANTTITRANAYLAGGANFVSTAYDTLVLMFSGVYNVWVEVSRSANS